MQPGFGWVLLSRDALRRAETQLRDDVEGVRDEIGFLALHQGYADRFFPGTSVLHTRLRYALFVPWIYEKIARQSDRQRISAAVERQELELTRRLKNADEAGVIGIRRYPKPTSQPPSMVYWTALGTWRILRTTRSGAIPSRQTVHRAIARKPVGQHLHDDDKQLLMEDEPLFCSLPSPPKTWSNSTDSLTFRLADSERRFLRNCFLSVERPNSHGTPSLLAHLVEQEVKITDRLELWSSKIRGAADPVDRDALLRARQAAALSAIGRGIYAALVEDMREKHDELTTEKVHRANLSLVIDEHVTDALALNVDAIAGDALSIPSSILNVLKVIQDWLCRRNRDLAPLYETFERAESRRKGRRARLSKTLSGRERRAVWTPHTHPKAEPLHYRWKNVRRLLRDLQGEP